MADVEQSIFRTYDIRGIAGTEFTEDTAYLIGRSIATKLQRKKLSSIACGRDVRVTSPALSQALIKGLIDGGIDVYDIGVCTTPVLYYACKVLTETNSGVMVTASHNPAQYNGAKIVIENTALSSEEIQALYHNCCDRQFSSGAGTLKHIELLDRYIDDIVSRIQLRKKFRVAVDYGNSVSALVVPKLFKCLGIEVINLFDEIDGNFPNHPPEPTQPQYLTALQALIEQQSVDLAFAFDGDADRMVCLDHTGDIIFPDRVLMLFARSILKENIGGHVVYDVKCNHHLARLIESQQGYPVLSPTGHTIIKQNARKENAVLAGEMSGHFIFYDNWYGFDDGVYAACRLLEILDQSMLSLYELNHQLPVFYSTPEIQLQLAESDKHKVLHHFAGLQVDGAVINRLDGVRIEYTDGFGLVRASNTTPCLVFRFVADTQQRLDEIKADFKRYLQVVLPEFTWEMK